MISTMIGKWERSWGCVFLLKCCFFLFWCAIYNGIKLCFYFEMLKPQAGQKCSPFCLKNPGAWWHCEKNGVCLLKECSFANESKKMKKQNASKFLKKSAWMNGSRVVVFMCYGCSYIKQFKLCMFKSVVFVIPFPMNEMPPRLVYVVLLLYDDRWSARTGGQDRGEALQIIYMKRTIGNKHSKRNIDAKNTKSKVNKMYKKRVYKNRNIHNKRGNNRPCANTISKQNQKEDTSPNKPLWINKQEFSKWSARTASLVYKGRNLQGLDKRNPNINAGLYDKKGNFFDKMRMAILRNKLQYEIYKNCFL